MPQDENQQGQMTVDGEYATLVFKRLLHHKQEHVWSAITDPEELTEWLMATASIDGRVDGIVDMVSGPARYHSRGKVLAWDPPRVFEYEWKVDRVAEMPMGEDAIFRYELAPAGSSTLLTVTYRRISKGTATGFAPGTHALLDRLEAQLDGAPLPDWFERFAQLRSQYPDWIG